MSDKYPLFPVFSALLGVLGGSKSRSNRFTNSPLSRRLACFPVIEISFVWPSSIVFYPNQEASLPAKQLVKRISSDPIMPIEWIVRSRPVKVTAKAMVKGLVRWAHILQLFSLG